MPSLLKRIGDLWQRLRHSRGFGVHSPFAYRFITDTLRQEHAYYAYNSLRTPQERLVFRVVLALRPSSVAIEGLPALRKAVRYAMPSARHGDSRHADMLIVSGAEFENHLAAVLSSGKPLPHLLLVGRRSSSSCAAWRRAMTCGMTFDNGSDAFIAASRPDLPRQDFDIAFH